MAASLAVNDILEGKYFCLSDRFQIGINVVHYYIFATTGASITDEELVGALSTAAKPLYLPLLYNGATYEGMSIQRIYPLPKYDPQSFPDTGTGTGGASPLPTQDSGIIKKLTGFAGRKERGRVYVPFPSTSHLFTNNTPTAAYVTALNALANQILAAQTIVGAGGTADIRPIVFHRSTNTGTFITTWQGQKHFATQRRRGDFGQANVDLPF